MAHHQVHKKFQVSTVVNKPVEEVWKTIRHFNDLRWGGVPDVKPKDEKQALTDNIIGTDRIITLGGKVIDEILLEYSETNYFYSYHIVHVDDGVFPGKLSNYHATLRLHRVTDGNRTFVDWHASFDGEPETADAIVAAITNGVFLPALQKL